MLTQRDPEIPLNDKTPSVLEQCAENGWQAGLYDFRSGIFDNVTFFNPGLVERPDGLWLLVRRSQNEDGNPIGLNSIWAVKLDDSGTKVLHARRLKWKGAVEHQQFEDARAFYIPELDQVGVSACTFKWEKHKWTGAVQVLGFFDKDWNGKATHFVPFDTNGRNLNGVPKSSYQKNWLFWKHDGKLRLLYKSNPWIVASFGDKWSEREIHTSPGIVWSHGEARGGTPPLLVNGHYITFFHSSMPWTGRYRRYYMGAIAFAAEPPFAPLAMTREPVLIGSQRGGIWTQRKPACIFPTGAVIQGDSFLVTSGLNDLATIWTKIPVKDVLARLFPIDISAPLETEVIETQPTTKPAPPDVAEPEDARKKANRERMAKVRAARGTKKRLAEPAAVA